MVCPYCGSGEVVIRDLEETRQKDDCLIVVYSAYCRDCAETFYALRTYREAGDCEYIRREDLKSKTKAVSKRSVLRMVFSRDAQ